MGLPDKHRAVFHIRIRDKGLLAVMFISLLLLILTLLFRPLYHTVVNFYLNRILESVSFLLNITGMHSHTDYAPPMIYQGSSFFRAGSGWLSFKVVAASAIGTWLVVQPEGIRNLVLGAYMILFISLLNVLRLYLAIRLAGMNSSAGSGFQMVIYQAILIITPAALWLIRKGKKI
jgi:hypothetical protein